MNIEPLLIREFSGSHQGETTYRKFMCERQRVFLSANMASMGFGLPAALSAKIDFPDKQAACVTGDGGFWRKSR